MDFIKKAFDQFLLILKQLVEYFAPLLAIILNLVIYFLLLYVFKSVGQTYDVTSLSVFLTIALVIGLSFLDFDKKDEDKPTIWIDNVKEKFIKTFRDGFEVVIFIFFLTMDSTNLFFLPDGLNTEVKSVILDYDLMKRGFTLNNHLNITIILVVGAIAIEIFRYILRIGKIALLNYNSRLAELIMNSISERKAIMIKNAIRKGVADSKKNIMKFITFTTFLIMVFLLFPRLKVLLLLVTSTTALILDMLRPGRLVIKNSDDLINRLLTKIFKF